MSAAGAESADGSGRRSHRRVIRLMIELMDGRHQLFEPTFGGGQLRVKCGIEEVFAAVGGEHEQIVEEDLEDSTGGRCSGAVR